jgi:hypothetical protein
VLGLFAGGANAHSSSVTFRFEPAGRLIDYSTSQSDVLR